MVDGAGLVPAKGSAATAASPESDGVDEPFDPDSEHSGTNQHRCNRDQQRGRKADRPWPCFGRDAGDDRARTLGRRRRCGRAQRRQRIGSRRSQIVGGHADSSPLSRPQPVPSSRGKCRRVDGAEARPSGSPCHDLVSPWANGFRTAERSGACGSRRFADHLGRAAPADR